MTHYEFTVAPEFFDLVLPKLGERGSLTHRQIIQIQKELRETGPEHAINVLSSILEQSSAVKPTIPHTA